MNRFPVRAALTALAAGLLAIFAVACGSSDDSTSSSSSSSEAKTIAIEITDAGCSPQNASAPAGPINFDVTGNSASVTEMEVLDGETILGEKENLTAGLTGSFSLTLEEGEYTLRCNGADEEDGTLKVSGKLAGGTSPEVEAAIAQYRGYLEENTDELTAATKPFVAAVVAGDVAKAKSLYGPARIPYERIEPVAESFGDLDPRIDARENDVPANEWSGFHKIEKALWVDNSAKGMAPVAEQLLADVEELEAKVKTVNLQAVQIANGANELLGEVSASKITGEEERYSHIDLVDFEANVEGAEAAFEAVKPLLDTENDPELPGEIEDGFAKVEASLKPYRQGQGFVLYTDLTKADTRTLAIGIDSLAELLAEMPVQIAGGEADQDDEKG
jgi:iron uptake system component EfeO